MRVAVAPHGLSSDLRILPAVLTLAASAALSEDSFVSVSGTQFMLHGEPYRYVGTNMWYAAYLGASGDSGGDRERLRQELDTLAAIGITNIRILGASERSPLRDAMRPAISYRGRVEREDLLEGLDYALSEMAARDMKAVIYLNNFWEWSGGMATYLSWVNDGKFVDMSDPDNPWPAFPIATAGFYANDKAVALFNDYVETLLTRRNTITGMLYRDDPTIMSWQLANEPRPGHGEASYSNLPDYHAWIDATAELIKSLAPKQLVSVGSEGTKGCLELESCYLRAHSNNAIDYATFHLWPKNWGWYDDERPESTFDDVLANAREYIDHHVEMAKRLEMPLVLEEFGLPRDAGRFSPDDTVGYRDRFFTFVFGRIRDSALSGGPLAGSNFWAWGGSGRALHDDWRWREGDSLLGDPPHEPQGWYSVFATDRSTIEVLQAHAAALAE
jgi:mannan endo-1,4-beta-mannosidase